MFWLRFALTSFTVRQDRQGLPLLIHPSYRFIITSNSQTSGF
nr:hypothetical protein [Candidatus Enterovibrio escacola]